jgi:hypothetical protein
METEEKKSNRNNTPEESKAPGLSKEQYQEQLDQFESQKIQFEQAKILLDFDLKNYKETLERKIRNNDRNLALVNSNIKVIQDNLSEWKD